jgi:hypothetical protein
MSRFFYGMFGSFVPDVVVFYSKRFLAPVLDFNIVQYTVAALIYGIVAGVIARIYPYKISDDERWNAVVVGITLPFIVSGLISVADRTILNPSIGLTPRGAISAPADGPVPKQLGTVIDLMALY